MLTHFAKMVSIASITQLLNILALSFLAYTVAQNTAEQTCSSTELPAILLTRIVLFQMN